MPNIGSAVLLPLDGLGGNKFIAKSSRDSRLEPLTGSGMQYQHASAALTLPSFTIALTATQGGSGAGAMTLPSFVLDAGGGGRARLKLPALTLSAAGTVPGWGTAALTLPRFTVAAAGITGTVGRAALRLPLFTVAARFGHHGALTLPRFTMQAAASRVGAATANLRLPSLTVVGNCSLYSSPGSGAMTLPAFRMVPPTRATLTLPRFTIAAAQAVGGSFEGWAINLRNKGVTRLTNYPFTQFTRVGGVSYGVANGNLYQLGGDLDDEDDIPWEFQTGTSDLGSPGQKHLPYLYIDGVIDGKVQIVVIDDRDREFAYHYEHKGRQSMVHKRKIGNGIRTRSVAYRLSSDTGAYLDLNTLEPEGTITERSI